MDPGSLCLRYVNLKDVKNKKEIIPTVIVRGSSLANPPITALKKHGLKGLDKAAAMNGKHMSSFQIYFKSNQFVTMERNELFGITDFLANFGGLLGLFVGFSLLSLIEIVYFLTLRIFCNVALFGRHNWSGIKE
ncbi:unnamed protein product [Diabrotica balteata]|uniref:Pickpocket protein 28 n=1 Tax=Diabrotica balteata TaxID=107213 RepID=A0A9N9T0F1_DIABA|nr:unnamed protein product [Diabrotica balteata]